MLNQIKNELIKALSTLKGQKFEEELPSDTVKVSERVVGGKVEIIQPDGTLETAPDGEYELSDGFKFIVKDGVIASIDGETEEMEVEQPNDNQSNVEGEIATLKDEIAAIKEAIAALTQNSASTQEVQKFQAEFEKLNETLLKLAKLPTQFSQVNPSNVVKDKTEDKLMDFVKRFRR